MAGRPKTRRSQALGVVKDLPHLTPKQMAFVDGILAGKSAELAYRDAYDAGEMSTDTVRSAASKVRRQPDVDAWIRAGYVAHLTQGAITKEEHVRELGAIRELSKEQGDLKTAVAAEHLRGKVSGFYVERSEHTVYDPAAVLAQINAIDPAIAARLADRFNLALPVTGPASEPADSSIDLHPIDPSQPPLQPED